MQRVTRRTRWILCLIPWIFLLSFVEPVTSGLRRGSVPAALMGVLVTAFVVQTVLATAVMAYSVGHQKCLIRTKATIVVLAAVQLAALPALREQGWLAGQHNAAFVCALVMAPLAGALATTSVRTYSIAAATACVLALAATAVSHSAPAGALITTASTWLLIGLTMRSSVWYLSILCQLDAAREAQGQLAVAEERLRFARDLHDTMGRDLAVIALKSELAARLCAAEDPRAGDEMTQIQLLARQSQNGFREVVRGYRATNLVGELAGARSVLEAAGIISTIENETPAALTDETESVLGWAVREGVTNILRHSEARHCTIRLTQRDSGPRLVITNDRARPSDSAPGTGLTGLSQRLAPVGGTLQHGPGPENSYRLTVQFSSPSAQKAHS
ncbi:sensor histidine kinase [Streptomyces sp. NPDC058280]|uniref:sensor histidine kinase n=1 Tax=Streptomyces sp. NPDC058280 TaxID=3346419 RepID=UPI0036EDE040